MRTVMFHQQRAYIDTIDTARRETRELERIVRSAAGGDRTAWADIVRRFAPRLRAIARMHRLGSDEAEDVAQTAFLRLVVHIGRLQEPSKVGAWLEVTARNESRRVLRGDRRLQSSTEPLAATDDSASPEDVVLERERRAVLVAATDRLSARQRELARLLLDESKPSYGEIAARLGIPIGSIGPTRARLLEGLRNDPDLVAFAGPERC